jgi:hypothetical protein
MKIRITTLVLLLASQVTFAQVTKKVLELPEFKSIYVNSNYTVYIKQTNKQEVSVEALTDIYSLTDISVVDGILMINIERKPETPNKSIWAKIDDIKLRPTMKVFVSMKNIEELQVNGGGKIIAENSLATSKVKLAVNGTGSMDVDLKGDVVTAEVTGSGSLALRGYATRLEALLAGSGSLNGFSCALERAKVRVAGSGICEVNVTEEIDAVITGSGTVRHKGNTRTAQRKIYGSGVMERAY